MYDKIIGFMEDLEEDDVDRVQEEIGKMHQIILTKNEKFQAMANDVLTLNDDQTADKFFTVQGFLNKEITLYQEYIDSAKDFQSYIFMIKEEADKFPESQGKGSVTPNPKTNSSANAPSQPPRPPSKLDQKQEKALGAAMQVLGGGARSGDKNSDKEGLKLVAEYFTKLEERSKSPISRGFKNINSKYYLNKTLCRKKNLVP